MTLKSVLGEDVEMDMWLSPGSAHDDAEIGEGDVLAAAFSAAGHGRRGR
jgi:hypothetical protein